MLAHHWRAPRARPRQPRHGRPGRARPAWPCAAGDRAFPLNAYAPPAATTGSARARRRQTTSGPTCSSGARTRSTWRETSGASQRSRRPATPCWPSGDHQTAAEAEPLDLANLVASRTAGRVDRARVPAQKSWPGPSAPPLARESSRTSRARGRSPATGRTDCVWRGKALEMAESLRLDELRAHALATISRRQDVRSTTPRGVEDGEQARSRSPSRSTRLRPARSPTTWRSVAVFKFDLRRAGELFAEGLQIAARFGDASNVRWLRHQCAVSDLVEGRWDEALRRGREPSSPNARPARRTISKRRHANRALIREARGDVEGALAGRPRLERSTSRARAATRRRSCPSSEAPSTCSRDTDS